MSSNSHPPTDRRLAYLFSRYPVVSHTFIDNEILALEANGWKIVLAALSPPKNDFRHSRLDDLQAPVIYSPPTFIQKACDLPQDLLAEFQEKFGASLEPEKCLRNAIPLAARMQQLGVSQIHVHFANRATYAAMFIKRLTGIPYSFTPQAADFLIDLESQELLAAMCEEAEFIIAPCDYAADKLAALCSGSAAKIRRVYNGIDPDAYPPASPQPTADRLRIASIGRFVEFKGFQHIIEAIAIARSAGVDVEFHLQGDGPLRQQLENQADNLDVSDLVHFEGIVSIDEMRRRFTEVDAFVLPCTTDQRGASDMLPTVITEAMLAALPVISCPIAGVPEQVQHQTTGLLVDPDSPQQLAAALVELVSTPGKAAQLGQAGRQFATNTFSIQTTLPQLESLLTAVKAQAQPPQDRPCVLVHVDQSEGNWAAPERQLQLLSQSQSIDLWVSGLPSQIDNKLAKSLADCCWLPDAMTLEMEWQQRMNQRATIESLRNSIGDAINGEEFLECGRRSLWLALQLPRLYHSPALVALDANALISAWIASNLIEIPIYSTEQTISNIHTKLGWLIRQSAVILPPAKWLESPKFLPGSLVTARLENWLRQIKM